MLRRGFYGRHDIFTALRGAVSGTYFAQFRECGKRPAPGAKFLRGKFLPRNLAQIIIHVVGADMVLFTRIVQVMKKFLSGQMLAGANDFGHARVMDCNRVLLVALAPKMKLNGAAGHGRMAVFHRGEAVSMIVARGFLVAHANEADFQQSHDRSQDFFAAKTFAREVLGKPAADGGMDYTRI